MLFCFWIDSLGLLGKDTLLKIISHHTFENGSNTNTVIESIFTALGSNSLQELPIDFINLPQINSDLYKNKISVPIFNKKARQQLIELCSFNWKTIDADILGRHPFPGPGLAIRIPGKINIDKIRLLQEVDDVYISYLKEKKLYNKIWQAFAVLLPVKSVGVMGDERTYNYCVSLRAVTSVDGMTADFYMFKQRDFNELSSRIINTIKGVNRVLYDFTSKPPGTIEWE